MEFCDLTPFTMGGTIPWVLDYKVEKKQRKIFQTKGIEKCLKRARKKEPFYYGQTDLFLWEALDLYAEKLLDKEVVVIGSQTPWYETILLTYQALPTTVEHTSLSSLDPRIQVYSTREMLWRPFDFMLSISSIEHDGLGRYNEPLDPEGDLKTMHFLKDYVKEVFFLSVPLGADCLVWNAKRIYGPKRLSALLKGWEVLQIFGLQEGFEKGEVGKVCCQPVFVLGVK